MVGSPPLSCSTSADLRFRCLIVIEDGGNAGQRQFRAYAGIGKAHRAVGITIGDFQQADAAMLFVIGAQAAIVRATEQRLRLRRGKRAGFIEGVALQVPLGIFLQQLLLHAMPEAVFQQEHGAIADDDFRGDRLQALRTHADGHRMQRIFAFSCSTHGVVPFADSFGLAAL